MNTVEEILKRKDETIYETYRRVLCPECNNRHNTKDLCNIVVTMDKEAKCINYKRCMENQCKTCSYNKECLEEEVKQNT